MPGGGRQWNKSAGKEKEKPGTAKRASKTRHGGTGGERRAAPVTRRSGVPRAARADGARGNVGARGCPELSPVCLPQSPSSPHAAS